MGFDGTLNSLITEYKTDPDSYYQKIRRRSRQTYDGLMRRLGEDYGTVRLGRIKARTLTQWHAKWSTNGRLAIAQSLIGMLRMLLRYGATLLEDPECFRLTVVLRAMKFPKGKTDKARMTAEYAIAIREMAHRCGLHSIAIAQAFQFDGKLSQTEVIGEYVPLTETGDSDTIDRNEKWLRGLRWEEIGKDWVLRHVTSKGPIEVNLRTARMVLEELRRLGDFPTSGPIVTCEYSLRPWHPPAFRRTWRKIADAAGVPSNVFNTDSRRSR